MTLIAGRLAHGGAEREGWLRVAGERIEAVGFGAPPAAPDVVHDGPIARGLCDLQVNGAGGLDASGGIESLRRIDAVLLAHGVTSYLPTLVSMPADETARALDAIGELAADPDSPVEGAHLEGPFLNPEFAGAHPPELLADPADGVPGYYDHPAVRLVTVAPERPGALELIAALARRPGVTVSLGHSGASAAEAVRAFEAGARLVTHLFNAMAPLHHREPALAAWALTEPGVGLGVIADGLHVDALVLRLIALAAGDRVVLVSDSSTGAGAPPGHYRVGATEFETTADGRALTADGRLAGSTLFLDEAVRRWRDLAGVGLAAALDAAARRPAEVLGLDGELAAGAFADAVLLTDEGAVERVLRRGRWVD